MLCEIGLIIMAISTPYFCYKSYELGYRAKEDGKIAFVKKKKFKKVENSKEIERLQTILANIENYDGTSIGQKEV